AGGVGVDRREADGEIEGDKDRRQADQLALPDRAHVPPALDPRWRGDLPVSSPPVPGPFLPRNRARRGATRPQRDDPPRNDPRASSPGFTSWLPSLHPLAVRAPRRAVDGEVAVVVGHGRRIPTPVC